MAGAVKWYLPFFIKAVFVKFVVKIQSDFNVVIVILRIRIKFAALFSKTLSYFNIIKMKLGFLPLKATKFEKSFINLKQVSSFALKLQLSVQVFFFPLHLYRFQRFLGYQID